MTVDAAAVERWARALGVWRDDGRPPDESRRALGRQWVIWAAPWTKSADCKFWIRMWEPAAPNRLSAWTSDAVAHGPLDPLTAALLLAGHARGLRVDVGECPACNGDGLQHWGRDPDKPKPAPWKSWEGWKPGGGPQWCKHRSCPSCPPGTKHARGCTCGTGRHTLPWEAAIIAAMPRDQSGLTPAVRASSSKRYLASFDGDASTRESLAVTADAMQASADALGELVTAWLRGECPRCEGDGHTSLTVGLFGGRTPNPCPACNGHGSVLGGFERKLAQAIEAELGRRAA